MVRICCFVVVYFFSVGHYNLSQVCLVFYVEMVFKMESFYFIAIRKNSGSFLVPVLTEKELLDIPILTPRDLLPPFGPICCQDLQSLE